VEAMAGKVVHEVERLGVVCQAVPIDLVRNCLAADFLDFLHAARERDFLALLDLPALVQSHSTSPHAAARFSRDTLRRWPSSTSPGVRSSMNGSMAAIRRSSSCMKGSAPSPRGGGLPRAGRRRPGG